jgi:zinc D-Ala-D-Ala carboxypeptidase
MTAISDHFTWEEATVTQQPLPNQPTPEAAAQLVHTFQEMERVRALCGPVLVRSAYRSAEVNRAVGGAPNSQHCQGEAVDFTVRDLSVREVCRRIKASSIQYDQIIGEPSWIHISFVHGGRAARRQALTTRIVNGRLRYVAA